MRQSLYHKIMNNTWIPNDLRTRPFIHEETLVTSRKIKGHHLYRRHCTIRRSTRCRLHSTSSSSSSSDESSNNNQLTDVKWQDMPIDIKAAYEERAATLNSRHVHGQCKHPLTLLGMPHPSLTLCTAEATLEEDASSDLLRNGKILQGALTKGKERKGNPRLA